MSPGLVKIQSQTGTAPAWEEIGLLTDGKSEVEIRLPDKFPIARDSGAILEFSVLQAGPQRSLAANCDGEG
jgi:hypothetical protein